MLNNSNLDNRYFEKLLEASDNWTWVIDALGRFVDTSQNIEKLAGYSRTELFSKSFVDFIPQAEHAHFLNLFANQQPITHFNLTFFHKSQQLLTFEINAFPLFIDQTFQGYCGISINITHHKIIEEKLRYSEKNLAAAQRIAQIGSWELDLISNQLFWSDEIYRILGSEPHALEASYENFIKVIHPDDLEMVLNEIQAAMIKKNYDIQHRVLQANGKIGILHERGEVIFDEQGTPIRMIGTTQNITELKQAQQKIEQLVNYDFLTQLPNRTMFVKQCEHLLKLAKHNQQTCALFCLGIDRFKLINESLGHEVGNQLLKAVAQRLNENIHNSDFLARLGGDEFVFMKINTSHADIAALFAQKLINQFAEPFFLPLQENIVIGLSIGITLCPLDNRDVTVLCKDAQTAMHRAKSSGGNSYQFYSFTMTESVKQRLSLEAHLRRALEQEEFLLYYQPKVATQTGKIIGAEALLRWQHPERGLIAPVHFVSILEDTGLIVPVGEWILHDLCRQYGEWCALGFTDISLALNLSVKQFIDSQLCEKVQNTLQKFNHNANFLELEVTESLLMGDFNNASSTLKKLHALGIRLAIDDFGTGYSSLTYLKLLPVDTLKIDRSFITGLPEDCQDKAIVEVILMLAKALDLKVVAEGVETEAQLKFLAEKQCDYIQGYYYSRPVPGDVFLNLLRENIKNPPLSNLQISNIPSLLK